MQISAKIIADSYSAVSGKRITTFELEYPRWIHGELLTHRLFSRNSMSSRAVPVTRMIEQVRTAPATPIHWGLNTHGMQAKEECDNLVDGYTGKEFWEVCAYKAVNAAEEYMKVGYHKQIVNRLLEPFQWMKTVVTATEWENFFWLRNHEDAQPEIKRLAEVMWEALTVSHPNCLEPGEWHVPYVSVGRDGQGEIVYFIENDATTYGGLDLQDALAISSSCCAQVSYRKLDDSLEKAQMVYKRLVESEPVHASPFEHQATPMKDWDEKSYCNRVDLPEKWEGGVTHVDRYDNLWSGNFKGWIQHRQLIPNNVKM